MTPRPTDTMAAARFMVNNWTLVQDVDGYREEVGTADVPWGPQGTRFFVLTMGFQWLW